jgi:hypothetical protein
VPAFVSDHVLDNGIAALVADVTHLYVCSAQPATYNEAVSTYALGNKVAPSITGPSDGSVSGRRAEIAAITDGDITSAGDATHFALVDALNNRLLVAQALSSLLSVTLGTFTLTGFSVTIPDAS